MARRRGSTGNVCTAICSNAPHTPLKSSELFVLECKKNTDEFCIHSGFAELWQSTYISVFFLEEEEVSPRL